MTLTLARAKLARAALLLNARNGFAGRLPALVLMTDDARLPDPLAAALALPRGTLVIVRSRDGRNRAALAGAMMEIAKHRDLIVSVADDPALALACGADGLHLPETRAHEGATWRARAPRLLITASAHSLAAIANAARAHSDAVLLSPVFATSSHPGRPAIGAVRARCIANQVRFPVYALGGIDDGNVMRLAGSRLSGVAAITALIPTAGRR